MLCNLQAAPTGRSHMPFTHVGDCYKHTGEARQENKKTRLEGEGTMNTLRILWAKTQIQPLWSDAQTTRSTQSLNEGGNRKANKNGQRERERHTAWMLKCL